MRHRGGRRRGRRRTAGQALVEFALIVPIFLLLLAGMIDFGMGLYSYMTIISSARDGARLGSIACGTPTPACSAPISTRVDAASGGLHPGVDVKCATQAAPATMTRAICDSGAAKSGGSITVTATYSYQMIWPLAFGTQIQMASASKFLVQ